MTMPFHTTIAALILVCLTTRQVGAQLQVGFARKDITPAVGPDAKPVWIAGYGQNRRATKVHDPLYAMVVVLKHANQKIALVSVDVVGLQYPVVQAIRAQLPGFLNITISSTHNHEGPDVIGLWGPSLMKTGVDPDYLKQLETRVVDGVKEAEAAARPASVRFGVAVDDQKLLRDGRLPIVYDNQLRVLCFDDPATQKPCLLLVQWNCHPEAMNSKNTEITADFPAATIKKLERQFGCNIAYFTGTVGGLMTVPEDRFKDANGQYLRGGNWQLMETYGEAVADLAARAITNAVPTNLTPFQAVTKRVGITLDNAGYQALRVAGVLSREAFAGGPEPYTFGRPLAPREFTKGAVFATEVGYLRLGEVHIACIPGEIYPELVYGQYQEPVDPGADFPEAPLETPVMKVLPGDKQLLLGLANDEVGYILPKRQWDFKPPFCYGRRDKQYGEINSCGPETGPTLLRALVDCVKEAK